MRGGNQILRTGCPQWLDSVEWFVAALNEFHSVAGRLIEFRENHDATIHLDELSGGRQSAAHLSPAVPRRIGGNSNDDCRDAIGHFDHPVVVQQAAAVPEDVFGAARSHFKNAAGCRWENLNDELNSQQPGNLVNELAGRSRLMRREFRVPLTDGLCNGIDGGQTRKDHTVRSTITQQRVVLRHANGEHEIRFDDLAGKVNAFAIRSRCQIPAGFLIRCVVNLPRDLAGDWLRQQRPRIRA